MSTRSSLESTYGKNSYDFSALNSLGAYNTGDGIKANTWKRIITDTINKGEPLTETEIKSYIGGNNYDSIRSQYDAFLNNNKSTFKFDASGNKYDGTTSESSINTQNFYNKLGDYQNEIKSNLMLDPNDANATQYKQDMYGALEDYQADNEASLAASEMDSYAMLGQQQLQLENTIAEQRMKALKSGTTSAQLASQQLANMFAAQSGAAQVATSMAQTRRENANQFAQSKYSIVQDMYNNINTNKTTYANSIAQLGAVAGSYSSTMDQPTASWDAWKTLSIAEQNRSMNK